MKPNPSFTTILLACVLVLLLLQFGLPTARTANVTPVTAAPASQPVQQDESGCSTSRSIQVTGAAMINVVPDRATIQLGVQSNGKTTRAVEERNTSATQAVIRAVRLLGVDAKDIATDVYMIDPIYEDYESLRIKGYRINNIIAITLRDVSKTSQVLGAALQAGTNQVIKVDFYTSELRKYRDEARELAMKAAREKADALTAAAGAETGCVLSIHENSWSYYNGWWYGRGQDMNQWTQNVIQNAAPAGGESGATSGQEEPISLGQISVKAEINASFGLK